MGRRLKNIHPGEILREEFLKPMNISAYRFSLEAGISQSTTYKIIRGTNRITSKTAQKLSDYFRNTPEFWIKLQKDYDLEEVRRIKSISTGRKLKSFTKKQLIERALISESDYKSNRLRSQEALEGDSGLW